MPTETKNFGLSKDNEEDFYSIDRVNANTDKVDTVLGNVAIYEKAAGTATEILLSGVNNNDGNSKTFVVSYNNNAATTKINGKPLYKQGTEESPKLVAGQAASIWYNATNNCFYIKEGGNASTVNGHTVDKDVPSDAKFTDTVYSHPETHPASMITGLPTSLPANDVYSWAKQQNKPSYNASEVGALPVNGKAQSAGVADSATNATNAAQADKIDGYHIAVLPQATYDAAVKDPTTIYFTY